MGILLGYFLVLRYTRTLVRRFFGRSFGGDLKEYFHAIEADKVEEEERWLWRILALLDRLSIGGAFVLSGDGSMLLNETFFRSTGLHGRSMRKMQAFEIPVFGEALLQAFSSSQSFVVPQSGFTLSPLPLGKHCLVLLEDERKKTQRTRSLRYFLTALWHEVQTPLTVLSGYLSTLGEGAPVDREILSRMIRQVHRLEGTIREVQKLSLLLEGKGEPISCAIFFSLLQRVVEEQKIRREDVTVTVDVKEVPIDCCLPLSEGEAFVLLSNLVANACTFSTPSGKVWVSASCREPGLTLVVENTASLPDAEFLSWFFDPTESPPRGGSGKGVGLYLVREVVEEKGGELRFRMQGEIVTLEVFLPRRGESS
ncbi:MAG: HAMP domain-containing sensor histidine kinase [Atribacterota bacterium]